jgi:hypothetical protein
LVAASLPRSVPDADRGVIYEFAMDKVIGTHTCLFHYADTNIPGLLPGLRAFLERLVAGT